MGERVDIVQAEHPHPDCFGDGDRLLRHLIAGPHRSRDDQLIDDVAEEKVGEILDRAQIALRDIG